MPINNKTCYTPTSLWRAIMEMEKPKIIRIEKTIGKEFVTVREQNE